MSEGGGQVVNSQAKVCAKSEVGERGRKVVYRGVEAVIEFEVGQ